MAEPANEPEPANDADLLAELVATDRGLLTKSEALMATLQSRLEEADTTRTRLTDIAASAASALSEVSATATAAIAARTQVTDELAVIAEKSAHIQAAQEHADKARAELDQIRATATQCATEADGRRSEAQVAADSAAALLATIGAHRTSADAELASITDAHGRATMASAATKSLADKSVLIEERIAAYETRLDELAAQSKAQLETITGLLPGATATGLAHAFNDRRQTFLKPAIRWQWLFVGSVVALVALAVTGLWTVNSLLGWDDLGRLWLARLPIAASLVWLALHASRESALAKRLEEDYGYKAAIAASFQGFQKQMADIGTSAPQGSPLSKLCEDTLSTIGSSPGRIYDKHRLTVTPAGELASVATKVVSLGQNG